MAQFGRYQGNEDLDEIARAGLRQSAPKANNDLLMMDEDEDVGAQTFRERVYVFFSLEEDQFLKENPNIFFYAAIYQLVNVLVIITSVILMIVDSAPKFYGRTISNEVGITVVEAITILFFLFDYVIRLVTAPRTIRFILNPLNIIDVLVIVPYFIQLGLELGLG